MSLAVAELGMEPHVFYGLSPRELTGALKVVGERRDAQEKRADERAAVIACVQFNLDRHNFKPVPPKLEPHHLFPHLAPEPMSDDVIYRTFRQFADAHNKRVNQRVAEA